MESCAQVLCQEPIIADRERHYFDATLKRYFHAEYHMHSFLANASPSTLFPKAGDEKGLRFYNNIGELAPKKRRSTGPTKTEMDTPTRGEISLDELHQILPILCGNRNKVEFIGDLANTINMNQIDRLKMTSHLFQEGYHQDFMIDGPDGAIAAYYDVCRLFDVFRGKIPALARLL